MNAYEFYEAVKKMRKADKEYYAYKAPLTDQTKQELLKAATEAEKVVDNEIARVKKILEVQQSGQQSINFN